MTESRTFPLVDIEPDEKINARRTRTDEGMDELKASILAHGLIQPLRVRLDAGTGKAKIIAGHRRHRALCELAAAGESINGVPVNDSYPVPTLVGDVDDVDARELSQAENFIRLPQHEADTYETFRELADLGLNEVQIAARFGIDPKRVKRMLALGRLSPLILEAWRSGEFNEHNRGATDIVRAFTMAPSIEEQERVYVKLSKNRQLSGHWIRQAFGGNDHEAQKHIKIAGLEAYEAAGGRVTRDLFGDEHIISDKEIAKQVAEEKVKAVLTGLKAEGWSWISLADDLPYNWTYGWRKEQPSDGKPTADEKKQIKKLEKAVTKGTAGAAEELATLQKAIAGRQWTPEQLAMAGAVLDVGYHGDLTIKRGVVKPEPTKKATTASGEKVEKVPTISNALAMRLSAQAGLAMRQALQQEPRLGLVALLAGFLTKRNMYGGARITPVHVSHEGMGHQALRGTEAFSDALTRLMEMTDAELFMVAAGIAGNAINLHVPSAAYRPFEGAPYSLAEAISGPAMSAALIQNFDIEDYFNGVAKSFIITAIREAVNDDEAKKADKLKKKELVEFAIKNVKGTGWLPPELRAPTYTGPGEIPLPTIKSPPTVPAYDRGDDDSESDPDFEGDDEEEFEGEEA